MSMSEYISEEVYSRLYKHMTPENALVVRLALETGLRVGDCLKVKREDISGQVLTYTAEKTGKTGKKKLSKSLCKMLLKNKSKSAYIFPGRDDLTRHRTRQAVWADLRKAAAAEGLQAHVTPHSARKTYAVKTYRAGGIPAVEKELQHDRPETSLIYALSDRIQGESAARSRPVGLTYAELVAAIKQALTEFFSEQKLTFSRK